MQKIIEPVETYVGPMRPANDLYADADAARQEILTGNLWLALSARHGLTVADFDWLAAHCASQRQALAGVKGFTARTRIMGEFLKAFMAHFSADERTTATEWRALNDRDLHGATERRHGDQRINDLRFLESVIDSLTT